MRIRVDPDQLRQVAQQMRNASNELGNVSNRVGNALSGMDFESRQKVGIESQVNQARNQANALASRAGDLARYLDDRARAFAEADRASAESIGQVSGIFSEAQQRWSQSPGGVINSYPQDAVETQLKPGQISPATGAIAISKPIPIPKLESLVNSALTYAADGLDIVADVKDWLAIPAALALGYTVREGGAIIVSGGGFLKDLVGLGKHLTVIRPENLPGHMARTSAALSLISLLPTWLRDIRDYKDQGASKLGAALLVDTILKGSLLLITSTSGTWLGGTAIVLAAGAIGVSAPALVVVAGGVVGSIILGYVGDAVFNWLTDSGIRQAMIDAVDQTLGFAGQAAQTAFGTGAQALSDIASVATNAARSIGHDVDNALSIAANAIQNISLPRLAPLW